MGNRARASLICWSLVILALTSIQLYSTHLGPRLMVNQPAGPRTLGVRAVVFRVWPGCFTVCFTRSSVHGLLDAPPLLLTLVPFIPSRTSFSLQLTYLEFD